MIGRGDSGAPRAARSPDARSGAPPTAGSLLTARWEGAGGRGRTGAVRSAADGANSRTPPVTDRPLARDRGSATPDRLRGDRQRRFSPFSEDPMRFRRGARPG